MKEKKKDILNYTLDLFVVGDSTRGLEAPLEWKPTTMKEKIENKVN